MCRLKAPGVKLQGCFNRIKFNDGDHAHKYQLIFPESLNNSCPLNHKQNEEKLPTNWEETFANEVTREWLISKIYKLIQLNIKKEQIIQSESPQNEQKI